MADPTLPSLVDFPSLAEKAGWLVVTILGLVAVVRWLSQAHLAALNGRIQVLERVAAEHAERERLAQAEILRRADMHAKNMQELTDRVTTTIRDHNRLTIRTHEVLSRMVDRLPLQQQHRRQGGANGYEPHPSSADLPAPPRQDEITTHRTRNP